MNGTITTQSCLSKPALSQSVVQRNPLISLRSETVTLPANRHLGSYGTNPSHWIEFDVSHRQTLPYDDMKA